MPSKKKQHKKTKVVVKEGKDGVLKKPQKALEDIPPEQ